jgi:hypothetical protein
MFNGVLQRTVEHKAKEITQGWSKTHKKEVDAK